MPIYLDTRGNSSLGIALCDRCSTKFPIGELYPDPNSPGLRVCRKDLDVLDPYRLPARQPEDITMRFTRPDTSIATNPQGMPTEDGDAFIIAEGDSEYLEP